MVLRRGGGLVADQPLQHHHQAAHPLAERTVGVLLQEGQQLGSDLDHHGGHVVSGQGVAVVQVHHRVLQVAEGGGDRVMTSSVALNIRLFKAPSATRSAVLADLETSYLLEMKPQSSSVNPFTICFVLILAFCASFSCFLPISAVFCIVL